MNELTKAALETLGAQLGEALFGQPGMTLTEVANRRDEVTRMAKDAGRYRWLRDRSWRGNGAYYFTGPSFKHETNLDAAIDASIAAMKEQAR